MLISPQAAAVALKAGKVITYPTEAVYGLGCDPFNQQAINQLLKLKQRDISKGLLIIAAKWSDVEYLVEKNRISHESMKRALATWPGPVTWLFPASLHVPTWIKGAHETIAIRITAHPTAHAICKLFGGGIVSTSANISNAHPARRRIDLDQTLTGLIVAGKVGHRTTPTPIFDIISGKLVRS
jgi:L-threonylcarbamoyladenylate synthase